MDRSLIKFIIERMANETAITFIGDREEMSVARSPRGVLSVGDLLFSAGQAATWVDSIRPRQWYEVPRYM
jgi:hypothetical protein